MMINFTPTTIINYYASVNLITAITLIMFARMKKNPGHEMFFLRIFLLEKYKTRLNYSKIKIVPTL